MPFYIDNAYGVSGSSSPYLTEATRSQMMAALSQLFGAAAIQSMLGSIQHNVIFTTFTSSTSGTAFPIGSGVYFPWGSDQAAWRDELSQHFSTDYDHNDPNVTPIPFDPNNDIVIFLSNDVLSNSISGNYWVYDDSGQSFNYALPRMMFHELAHVASQPDLSWSLSLGINIGVTEPWESDTVAMNAEDIIFRSSFPDQPTIAGSSPLVQFLNSLTIISSTRRFRRPASQP